MRKPLIKKLAKAREGSPTLWLGPTHMPLVGPSYRCQQVQERRPSHSRGIESMIKRRAISFLITSKPFFLVARLHWNGRKEASEYSDALRYFFQNALQPIFFEVGNSFKRISYQLHQPCKKTISNAILDEYLVPFCSHGIEFLTFEKMGSLLKRHGVKDLGQRYR